MSVISCKRDTGQSRLLQPAANVMTNKNKETDVLSRPPPPVCDHPKDKIFLSADVLSFNLLYVPPSPSLHIQLCSPLNCDFLPFALNTLLILPFSAPLYHLLSVWALADMVQACDSSGSLFLLSAPPADGPDTCSCLLSLRHALRDAPSLATFSFYAACFSIWIQSQLLFYVRQWRFYGETTFCWGTHSSRVKDSWFHSATNMPTRRRV